MIDENLAKPTFTRLSDTEMEQSYTYDAPRDLVWRAFTDSSLIPQWWGPAGLNTVVDQADFRVGGKWRYVQTDADGAEFAFRGEYREIVPPERTVATFEWEGMPGHIVVETTTFSESDGCTTVTVHSVYDSKEDLDGMLAYGMESGATETMQRMAVLLRTLA